MAQHYGQAKHLAASGQELIIVGAVQDLPDLQAALKAVTPLLKSAEQNIK